MHACTYIAIIMATHSAGSPSCCTGLSKALKLPKGVADKGGAEPKQATPPGSALQLLHEFRMPSNFRVSELDAHTFGMLFDERFLAPDLAPDDGSPQPKLPVRKLVITVDTPADMTARDLKQALQAFMRRWYPDSCSAAAEGLSRNGSLGSPRNSLGSPRYTAMCPEQWQQGQHPGLISGSPSAVLAALRGADADEEEAPAASQPAAAAAEDAPPQQQQPVLVRENGLFELRVGEIAMTARSRNLHRRNSSNGSERGASRTSDLAFIPEEDASPVRSGACTVQPGCPKGTGMVRVQAALTPVGSALELTDSHPVC